MRKLALFASLVFIFTLPWETAITVSTLGTLTKLVGIGAAGIWAVSVLITGRLRKFQTYHAAVLIFMLFNMASIFWTADLDHTMQRVKTYLQLAILTWLLWDLFNTAGALRLAMQAFILGAYVTIGSQLSNFVSGKTIEAYSDGRFSGAGQNAVELALILSLSLPLAWFLATTQKPGRGANFLKAVNFAYIPLALLATILTASRTALVTDIPGLLYIAMTMNRVKPFYRFMIFILIIIAAVAVQPFIPQATFDRLSTFGESITGNDLGGRTRLWNGSLAIFLEHPFLGIGSDALSSPNQLGSFAHNTFLSILAELGLVGFFLFAWVLGLVVYQALRQPKPLALLWITVITVWTVGVLTLTWEYTKPTWFFLNLAVISGGIYHQRSGFIPTSSVPGNALADVDVQAV